VARDRVALAAALALACATTPPYDPGAERCNPDGGFERGLADGKAGRAPDLAWLVLCDPAVHEPVGRAYREGHQAGLAARDADAPPAPAGARSERAYLCEVQARGDTFTAYGATKIAADAAARAACREKNPDHFCEESACRRNE
jgi:hypothetical protein